MKTFTIGDKTYDEDQFTRILHAQKLVKQLSDIQDSIFKELGVDVDIDNDHLFDFVYNNCVNVKVNNG
jgi:hypothetical protein